MRHFYSHPSRKILLISSIVLIDILTVFVTSELTSVVRTTNGPVQGEILTTVTTSLKYSAFKGIRFAEPPVGYQRFQPPVPAKPWRHIFSATAEGPVCVQYDTTLNVIKGSEDCLFINIFTPMTDLDSPPAKLKAVIVWIYGGSFESGSGNVAEAGPDYLLERDVVYVSFNYRLGPLGFLNLNHPNATGNAGLKDQNLALKWVRSNIKKFGGNPRNVTIFGESAGSVSVGLHILSDASAGLFHGAISMSGVPLNPWAMHTPQNSVIQTKILADEIGASSSDDDVVLQALYEASAVKLIASANLLGATLPFRPTIENATIAKDPFLTVCSIEKYHHQNYSKVPQMLGFMDQETISFAAAASGFNNIIDEAIRTANNFGITLSPILSLAKNISGLISPINKNIFEVVVNETSDLLFVASIDQTQKIFATNHNLYPIYYYRMSFYSNVSRHNLHPKNNITGAGHGDDIGYVFYLPELNYSFDPNDPVRRTINRVTTMWSNFAKYGNPTPKWVDEFPLDVTWPRSSSSGKSLNIGNELKVKSRPVNFNVKYIETVSTPFLSNVNGCES